MFAQAMKELRSDISVCMSPSYAMMPTWKRDNVRLGRCPEDWLSPLPHPKNLTCPRYIHILKLKLAHMPLFSICLCACVCVFFKHTPESSGVISEPSSPLPSFSATKYRLLDHLREWFCSLNITISTFSCPTETTPPTPFHTPLNSTYASSFSHLDTINPLRRPPTTQSPWKICHLSAGWVLLFSGPGSGHTCGVRGTVGIVNLC